MAGWKPVFTGGLLNRLLSSYLLLIIIPLPLIGYTTYKTAEYIIISKISESHQQTMNQISRNLHIFLDQATAIVNMNNMDASMETYLTKSYDNPFERLVDQTTVERSMLETSFAFDWLNFESYLVGRNGEVYSQDGYFGGLDKQRLLQLYADPRMSSERDRIVWTGAQPSFLKDANNAYVVNATKLLYNSLNQAAYGLFVLSIREDSLFRIYENSIADQGAVFIVDGEGRYITHSNRSLVGVKAEQNVLDSIRSAAARQKEEMGSLSNPTVLISAQHLDYPDWTLVMEVPSGSLFREIHRLAQTILAITASLIVSAVAVAVWNSRRIAMPLIRLNQRLSSYERTGQFTLSSSHRTVNDLTILTTEYEVMLSRLERTIMEMLQNAADKRSAELSALQAQINPHFLYNTLNSIKCLVWINQTESIEPVINALVKLLQMTIQRDEDELTLQEEFMCLECYVFIQEIRLSHPIRLVCDVDEKLMVCRLPKLLLQPIVENAIFHGFESNPESMNNATITVHAALSDEDDLRIEIEDNGAGIQPDRLAGLNRQEQKQPGASFNGIGMSNVHERLKMNYGPRYGISIRSTPGVGTTVTLTLPMKV